MNIKTIHIRNFRMMKKVTVDLEKNTSLFIGKNNSGKTSFIVLLENFLKKMPFDINDFPLSNHNDIFQLLTTDKVVDISIQLGIEIEYNMDDDLTFISSFIHDLDPTKNTVNILFEASIDSLKLLKKLKSLDNNQKKKREIKNNLGKYIELRYYIFDDIKEIDENVERKNLIEKELKDIQNLINIEVIHAKRDVASSNNESNKNYVISNLVSDYYNEKNKEVNFDSVNDKLLDLDGQLESEYNKFFESFLKTSEMFLDDADLKVVSDLESKSILKHNSKIIYGKEELTLPENLKGLGYTNIIYLILNLEIKLLKLKNDNKSINLFIIEEPEAHTHPQMQYIFIRQIKTKLTEWINEYGASLQTIITTHSSHIVNDCDFEDLRYFKVDKEEVTIKNFIEELKGSYDEKFKKEQSNEMFKFIKQYINIHSSELFFAEKIIMIEGITEKMLLPYFIKNEAEHLNSQNITVLEVGANAKAFEPLLNFLDIKTLIITDLDTVDKCYSTKSNRVTWNACEVSQGTATSNETLTHYLGAKELKRDEDEYKDWFEKLRNNQISQQGNIRLYYQSYEKDYHARSFEDAFLNLNYDIIYNQKDEINGLKKKDFLVEEKIKEDIYDITQKIIGKKSDFAASLLYLGLSKQCNWQTPQYIKDGLEWL